MPDFNLWIRHVIKCQKPIQYELQSLQTESKNYWVSDLYQLTDVNGLS
jgi:hypothetical protein